MNDDKVIHIRCESKNYFQLNELNHFQGNLKSIDEKSFDKLKKSLIKEGLPLGFHVWIDSKKKVWTIDGHHRVLALKALQDQGYHIPSLPCSIVDAKSKKEAAKIVMISNSHYAKMSQESISDFMIDFELKLDELDFLEIPELNFDLSDSFINNNTNNTTNNTENENGNTENGIKLIDKFIIPPFSYIDTKQDYFMKRVESWKNLGIESSAGRKKDLTFRSGDDFLGKINEKQGTTSIFNPAIAEIIYKWFTNKNSIILDPFSGGSVRGIVASHCERNYVGIDIREEQIDENIKQLHICKNIKPLWLVGD
jgi:hypothetical protein